MTEKLFLFQLSDGSSYVVSSTEFLEFVRSSGYYNLVKQFIRSNNISLTGDFRSFPIFFLCWYYYINFVYSKKTNFIDMSISYLYLSSGTTISIYNQLSSTSFGILLEKYGVFNYAMFSSSLRLSEQIFKSRNWKKHYLVSTKKFN